MTMCSGARLALLVYGIIMHSSAYCSPDTTGLPFPGIRSDDEAYDEDGNQLLNFHDLELPGVESPASAHREPEALNHPGEISDRKLVVASVCGQEGCVVTERSEVKGRLWMRFRRDVARVILNKAYHKVLDQLSRKKLLQKLVAKGVGGIRSGNRKDDWDPLSKRHSDGIFTDSYSRYRKQMAVKKYLAAVLGKRPEDINTDHLLLYINNDALLQGDFETQPRRKFSR